MNKTNVMTAIVGAAMVPWAAMADRTISENYTLSSNEDWTGDGAITLSGNPTIDLAGYTLKVHSITGSGTIQSSMIDLTSPNGTVSSSGGFNNSYPAANLFDNDVTTLAVRTATSGDPLIVVYDFGDGDATAVNCYRLYAAKLSTVSSPGFPMEWTFEASNDNSEWTVLDSRNNQVLVNETWFTFDFSNTTAYRYYRMKVTKGSRYNTSTSKDPRIDFGGEMELGFTSRGTLSVDLSGAASCDLSGITIADGVDVETVGGSLVLDADVDMRGFPVSATIDLRGHTLTVSALTGGGTITDSSAPAYTNSPASVTSSRTLNGLASNLFDGDLSTFAYTGATSADPVILTFGFDNATLINNYDIYAYTSVGSPGFPKEWTFEGSNDNATWSVLDSRSGVAMAKNNWYEYDFANTKEFTYYRLYITKGSRWSDSNNNNPRLDIGGEMKLCRRIPGKVVVNVPSGKTVENTDVTLSGSLRLVKEGKGTLIVSKSGQPYTGGTEVADGTLKCGASVTGLFGTDGTAISIVTNGTFDIAGIRASGVDALGKYAFTLNGGTLANSESVTGSVSYQSPMHLSLTSDSVLDAIDNSFLGTETAGLDATFDLCGHALSCSIANGKLFRINNMTLENGTFNVEDATTGYLFTGYGEGVVATNVDFRLNCSVIVRTGSTFKVRDYEPLGGANYTYGQYGAMEVYGAFRPTSDRFYGCTLMDGATLDLSTRSTTLNALSESTGGLTNLAFAANATINIHLGTRKTSGSVPLLSWTAETKPDNIDTVKFVRADEGRRYALVVKENGLYACAGLIISFH